MFTNQETHVWGIVLTSSAHIQLPFISQGTVLNVYVHQETRLGRITDAEYSATASIVRHRAIDIEDSVTVSVVRHTAIDIEDSGTVSMVRHTAIDIEDSATVYVIFETVIGRFSEAGLLE